MSARHSAEWKRWAGTAWSNDADLPPSSRLKVSVDSMVASVNDNCPSILDETETPAFAGTHRLRERWFCDRFVLEYREATQTRWVNKVPDDDDVYY